MFVSFHIYHTGNKFSNIIQLFFFVYETFIRLITKLFENGVYALNFHAFNCVYLN